MKKLVLAAMLVASFNASAAPVDWDQMLKDVEAHVHEIERQVDACDDATVKYGERASRFGSCIYIEEQRKKFDEAFKEE